MYPQPQAEFTPKTGTFQPPADAIARLGPEDLNLIESFLARALDLDEHTRYAIAGRIAAAIFAKMNVPIPEGTHPERALEAISHAMRSQGRV